ncbi:16S rRNA (cytosine(967)-C(5))-methyltransferase RsmB [Nevskia sp.]|uniref:16S rRNA (cytosine(967)-C(5))-methyltransferase RsmB n=1 Tax=Nevskia sp. TaxID=1929292 RepID=UPI0025DE014A|nr:16S rRNA (cytosine(967)-C(5))-methyltransferase RsmB [Nevskia sp.]
MTVTTPERITNVRAAAAKAVAAVMTGRNLDDALAAVSAPLSAADLSLLKAMAYGVVREFSTLNWLVGRMLQKPLREEPLVAALLACGVYQLRAMRVPAHAAVAETVAAAEVLGKPWAKGLTNALLRRYQREADAIEATLPPDVEVRQSYPEWLVRQIKRDWPGAWRSVLAAGNTQAPMTLRVNRRRGDREAFAAELSTAGIGHLLPRTTPDAVILNEPLPVERIPGFADGRVSVQDLSAQLAADLLGAEPGMRVLDACAAPGGKTAHLIERSEGLDVIAIESEAARLGRIRDTLGRLGLDAMLVHHDAADTAGWWKGKKFDRILIDAPCSGTGVIRRHPDIKWLRRETDIPTMAAQQLRLLRALWPLLKPQGVLVYATCSILKAEGEDVARAFMAEQPEAVEQVIDPSPYAMWGEDCGLGRRIEPGGDFDGFYYVRWVKVP